MRGLQYRPQNTIVLIIGTPKKGTPNFGKPLFSVSGPPIPSSPGYSLETVLQSGGFPKPENFGLRSCQLRRKFRASFPELRQHPQPESLEIFVDRQAWSLEGPNTLRVANNWALHPKYCSLHGFWYLSPLYSIGRRHPDSPKYL